MADQGDDQRLRHPAIALIDPDEVIHTVADAADAKLLVTDRRVSVATEDRIALDVRYDRLRRIQFDIERQRPAVLVIVPELPTDPPQVMSVPRERYRDVADALAIIGEHLHDVG